MSKVLTIGMLTALALAWSNMAMAQQKSIREQIVGAWNLVSWEQTRADGSKHYRFGTDAKGIETFDANGHFSLIIVRSDLPKPTSGNAERFTPEEAQAIAIGTIAYFGTYAVNEAERLLNLHLEAATLANLFGSRPPLLITSINDDELKYRNPNPSQTYLKFQPPRAACSSFCVGYPRVRDPRVFRSTKMNAPPSMR